MKIAVVSRSAGFHAKNIIANVLPNATYVEWHKQHLLKDYDVIYCLGLYVASMQSCQEYWDLLLMPQPLIIHWAGSDISLCKFYEKDFGSLAEMRDELNGDNVIHLAQTEQLADEVINWGINNVDVCTLPSRLDLEPCDLDIVAGGENDTKVSLYIPPGRTDFFKLPIIMEVAAKLPDIDFIICSFSSPKRQQLITDNVVDWGKLGDKAMRYLMESCNIHLRLVEHDGFSLSVIENKLMGRRVITNQDYPHTEKVSLDVDEIVAKIKELAEIKEPDYEGAKFYEENYGKARYIQYIKELLDAKR